MYDPDAVLKAIDQHWIGILALCSAAMFCNYAWFFAAVARGFRDRRYPMPIAAVLFWLVGDAAIVIQSLSGANAYDHWYLSLFAASLTVTVLCELVFLGMILRFGRQEWMPDRPATEFWILMLGGLVLITANWLFVRGALNDPLHITYFFLANMIGPPAAAGLALRRGHRAGTTPSIWLGYAAMLIFFYSACFAFYGPPYNGLPLTLFYVVNIIAALGTAFIVSRLPAAPQSEGQAPAAERALT